MALASRILVGEETWQDRFRRAKLKQEFGGPGVGKSPFQLILLTESPVCSANPSQIGNNTSLIRYLFASSVSVIASSST